MVFFDQCFVEEILGFFGQCFGKAIMGFFGGFFEGNYGFFRLLLTYLVFLVF